MRMALIKRVRSWLGIDNSILLACAGRGLGMILGPVGSLIIVFTLSVEDQGLYYLFLSLTSLRSFFDLGASAAIMQMAPHMKSHGADSGEGLPSADFIRVAYRWMNGVAVAFCMVCAPIGIGYLNWVGHANGVIIFMWLATVSATALVGSIEGRVQVVYGSGKVDDVNRLRISSQVIQYLVQWTLLLCGASLFSFGASLVAAFLWKRWNLKRKFTRLWPRSSPCEAREKEIRRDMGRLVRRASLTYVSGVLVFQIQQPIAFKIIGAEGSAKLGFSSMIGASLIGLASLWSLTMFPRFAGQVAGRQYDSAFRSFRSTWLRAMAVASLGFVGAFVALWILHHVPRFSARLMGLVEVLPLFAALFVQQLASALTFWPRAFKVEPFAVIALIQMTVLPIGVWFLTKHFGLAGIGWANFFGWLVGLVGIYLISARYFPGKTLYIKSKSALEE